MTTRRVLGQVLLDPQRLVFVGSKTDFRDFCRFLATLPPHATQLDALRDLRGELLALATTTGA